MTGNKQLTISVVYERPSENFIIEVLETLFSATDSTIIAGDLNPKHLSWNSRTKNRRGCQLFDFAAIHRLTVHGPTSPTFYHDRGYRSDVIDIAVVRDATSIKTPITTTWSLSWMSTNLRTTTANFQDGLGTLLRNPELSPKTTAANHYRSGLREHHHSAL